MSLRTGVPDFGFLCSVEPALNLKVTARERVSYHQPAVWKEKIRWWEMNCDILKFSFKCYRMFILNCGIKLENANFILLFVEEGVNLLPINQNNSQQTNKQTELLSRGKKRTRRSINCLSGGRCPRTAMKVKAPSTGKQVLPLWL